MSEQEKRCGLCAWWDAVLKNGGRDIYCKSAPCLFPIPDCVEKFDPYDEHGTNCPCFKPRGEGVGVGLCDLV